MTTKKIPILNFYSFTILIYMIFWFYQGHFLFQLKNPTLITTGIDNTYWLLSILRIPQITLKVGFLFDLMLIIFLIMGFKLNNKWWFRLTLLVAIIHTTSFSIFTGMHTKATLFFPLVLLPYSFPAHKILIGEGVRYYLCLVFVSAALYKILNGGLLYPEQFLHILQNQHTDLSILNPSNTIFEFSLWLITHPVITNVLWYLFFAAEAIFLIGLFTKNYDRYLLIILILIILFTYLTMRILLFDFLLFIPFLNIPRLNYLNSWLDIR